MDLIVRIEGGVQESNLEEYEKSALAIVEGINTELVTDDDFARAEQNIKDCKEVEDRIAQAKQDAMHSIDDISALFTMMDKLQDRFRSTRLELDKKVKNEKANRREQIVQAGLNQISEAVSSSSVAHAFPVSSVPFQDAVKGKRSVAKMEEAVEELACALLDELNSLQHLFTKNTKEIEEAESEYPGLFHDRKAIAVKPADEVKAVIKSRIDNFKLKQMEKAEAKRKAEESKEACQQPDQKKQPAKTFDDFPGGEPVSHTKYQQTILVTIVATDKERAELVAEIQSLPHVQGVR